MLGLFYIVFFGLYGWLSIWLTRYAIKVAKARGIAGWIFGFPVALVMYHLVFWDWVPTVVMHQYTCSAKAGFWEYKTVDQWKSENPGVIEGLVSNKRSPYSKDGDVQNYTYTYYLNEQFNWVVKRSNENILNRWRHEEELVDAINGEVLARYVDFSTVQERKQTGWSGWKFWLVKEHCHKGGYNQDAIRELMKKYKGGSK